jgi:hypothetical protein
MGLLAKKKTKVFQRIIVKFVIVKIEFLEFSAVLESDRESLKSLISNNIVFNRNLSKMLFAHETLGNFDSSWHV